MRFVPESGWWCGGRRSGETLRGVNPDSLGTEGASGRMCFWISPLFPPSCRAAYAKLDSRRKNRVSAGGRKMAGVKVTFSDVDGGAGESRLRGAYGPLVPNISALGLLYEIEHL